MSTFFAHKLTFGKLNQACTYNTVLSLRNPATLFIVIASVATGVEVAVNGVFSCAHPHNIIVEFELV